MSDANLYTRLDASIAAAGRAPAFVQPDGFTLRYDQVRSITARLANALNALGVGPRDLITILQTIKSAGALQADIETR